MASQAELFHQDSKRSNVRTPRGKMHECVGQDLRFGTYGYCGQPARLFQSTISDRLFEKARAKSILMSWSIAGFLCATGWLSGGLFFTSKVRLEVNMAKSRCWRRTTSLMLRETHGKHYDGIELVILSKMNKRHGSKLERTGSGIMAVIQGRVLRTIRSVGTTTVLKGSCDHDGNASCQVGDGISFPDESLAIWRDHLARYANPKKKHEDAWKVHTSRDSVKVGNWIISFLDGANLCLSVLQLRLLTHRVRNCA